MWLYVSSFRACARARARVCVCVCALYNKCKSTFQFSNVAKYSHERPEDGFKGDRKHVRTNFKCFSVRF